MKICLMEENYILFEEESQVEVTSVMLEGLWVCFDGRKIYEVIQLPLYFQVGKKAQYKEIFNCARQQYEF